MCAPLQAAFRYVIECWEIMQFDPVLFSAPLLKAAWGLAVVLVLLAVWRAPWRAIRAVPRRQHALFAAVVVLSLLWSFRYEVLPGLHAHPLLLMTCTLMFGWSLSLLAGGLALLLVVAVGAQPWQALPLDWLLTVVLPSSLCFGLMRVLYRLRLRSIFFYLLGLGFFGTIIVTFVACGLIALFLQVTQSPWFMDQLWERSAFVVPLLYSEGFLNGLLVTVITVYAPDLVKTFDEDYFR